MNDLAAIAENLGITKNALYRRLQRGWSPDRALSSERSRKDTRGPTPAELAAAARRRKPPADRPYRKTWTNWPMTDDQKAINGVLAGWKR